MPLYHTHVVYFPLRDSSIRSPNKNEKGMAINWAATSASSGANKNKDDPISKQAATAKYLELERRSTTHWLGTPIGVSKAAIAFSRSIWADSSLI